MCKTLISHIIFCRSNSGAEEGSPLTNLWEKGSLEMYSEPCQISKMKRFEKIVSNFLIPVTSLNMEYTQVPAWTFAYPIHKECDPLTISDDLYYFRHSKVLSMLHHGQMGRVQNKECYFIFLRNFLVFLLLLLLSLLLLLLFFIIKFAFASFSFLFLKKYLILATKC